MAKATLILDYKAVQGDLLADFRAECEQNGWRWES